MKLLKIFFSISLFISVSVSSQNTIGVLSNSADALNGYSLFTYLNETYLINNCGEVVNQWTSNFNSGRSVYLLENGNLLRAANIPNPGNIAIPGFGGRIELFDWDNNLLWEYEYSTENVVQHHDIFPMPNGNVLILAASILTDTEAIQLGRNPDNLGTQLYNEQILELEPVGNNDANIVWQWDIKDHLIQDFDNTKDNFGVIADNPQRLDINYLGGSIVGSANWLHANSVQYNAQLDQIIISIRFLNEFYIIDHSTTTSQAATSLDGVYGKGGDLLYRWGNPIAYKQGTVDDQKLFGQHYPHWIAEGLADAGKIIVFNNGWNRTPSFSEIDIINPPVSSPGVYSYTTNTAFGPTNPDYVYTAPVNTDFYSAILSGAQRIANGNILICEGTSGYFFEIDSNNNIVWEYINPVGSTGIMTQGDDPNASSNSIFRVKKYPQEYSAFVGKDLTPGAPIELNPDLSNCSILGVGENEFAEINMFPNPVIDILTITSIEEIVKIEIYNSLGKLIKSNINKNDINIKNLSSGIYIIKIFSMDKMANKKIIKI